MKRIRGFICLAVVGLLMVGEPAQSGSPEVRKLPAVKQAPAQISPGSAGMQQPLGNIPEKTPKGCRPDINGVNPLGCYEPGKFQIYLSGQCFGQQPGPYSVAVQAKGSPIIHRIQADSWSDVMIRFLLPIVPDLKPSTQADVGIVNAQNQWVDKTWMTTCTSEGTMPHYPPSSPGNVQVK